MDHVPLIAVVGCGVWLIGCNAANAKDNKSAEKTPAAPAVEQTGRISPEVAEREKVVREWRAKLSGTQWDLQLTLMGGQPGKPETDVLTFGQRTVGSEKLLKAGYPHSDNYTLYAPTEESIAWETMQLKDGSDERDMVIWRGEIVGDTIQGTLTKQRNVGDANLVEQFSFTGRLVEPAPERVPPAAQGEAPSAAPASEAPAAPQQSGGS